MVLLRQQWKIDRVTVATWAISLALLGWGVVAIYDVLVSTGAIQEFRDMLEAMPPSVQAMIGGASTFGLFTEYVSGLGYGGITLIVFSVFVATYVPGLISRESDQNNIEFLLSLPVERSRFVIMRWTGLALALAAASTMHFLGLVLPSREGPQVGQYLLASLNMYLTFLTVGSLLLLITVFIDDYSRAMGASLGLALGGLFGFSSLEAAEGPMKMIKDIIPFSQLVPLKILAHNTVPLREMATLTLASLVLLGLTVLAYRRKEIAG